MWPQRHPPSLDSIRQGSGADVVSRFPLLSPLPRWPSCTAKCNNFSNSESLCLSDAVWEEMLLEEFQDGGHLGYGNGTILAIQNLYVTPMPPIKFPLNLTNGLGGDVF